jgi:hypothetical protein
MTNISTCFHVLVIGGVKVLQLLLGRKKGQKTVINLSDRETYQYTILSLLTIIFGASYNYHVEWLTSVCRYDLLIEFQSTEHWVIAVITVIVVHVET